jgi:hypothetical protein
MRAGSRFAALLLPGVATLVLLFALARWQVPVPLAGPIGDGSWAGRTRPWFTTSGFSAPEYDEAAQYRFSWTAARAELRVPAIDRSQTYQLAFRIKAGRGPGVAPPPEMIVSIDGAVRLRAQTTNEPAVYSVTAPVAPSTSMVVTLDFSNTFSPGPNDRRILGVVVESVAIAPERAFRPLWPAAAWTAAATVATIAAALLCGLGAWWACGLGLFVATGYAWLVALDGAFMGTYVSRLWNISLGAAAVGAGVGLLRRLPAVARLGSDWVIAAAVLLVLTTVKLAVFGHPQTNVGDSIFQVHRAQDVAAGKYFFTSITPRPFYEFPYAIALYVTALPFWDWFPTTLDRMRLLRGVATVADGLVALAMYSALKRAWPDRPIALFCAVLWPFSRITMQGLTTSNLTNVFGQGVFGVAMGAFAWMAAGTTQVVAGAATAAASAAAAPVPVAALLFATSMLTVGLLGHFSTLSVGVPLVLAVAGTLMVFGKRDGRRIGALVLAALITAAALSYVVYYSHFHDTYRKTVEQLASGEGAGEARSLAAPIAVKARRWAFEMETGFGWPLLLAAVAGLVSLARTRPVNGLTLVFAAWAGTWAAFAALGVFTAIEMRANLAAAPLMFALAAFGLGSIATSRVRAVRAIAYVLAAAIAWSGLQTWIGAVSRPPSV